MNRGTPVVSGSDVMVFKSVKVLIATIGLASGSTAYAQVYVPFEYAESSKRLWSYDADSITRNDNTVTVWLKVDATKDRSVKFRIFLTKVKIECFDETYTAITLNEYSADGSLIKSETNQNQKMEKIGPGNLIILKLLKNVCF